MAEAVGVAARLAVHHSEVRRLVGGASPVCLPKGRHNADLGGSLMPMLRASCGPWHGRISSYLLDPLDFVASDRVVAHRIARDVCRKHGISWQEVLSPRRNVRYFTVRREICFKLRIHTTWSLPQIGRFVARDHTTVIHSIKSYCAEHGIDHRALQAGQGGDYVTD